MSSEDPLGILELGNENIKCLTRKFLEISRILKNPLIFESK